MATVLPPSLDHTDLPWLGERYQGKVRDCYSRGDKLVLVATDRLSAFDRILTTVPLKGQVLTQLARFWFERTEGLVPNHVVNIPDPSVMVANTVKIIPIEVVVRGYLAGSAWRDYSKGIPVSGLTLPAGLKEFDRLPEPLLTPSTKAELGSHDMPISEAEVVSSGVVSSGVWEDVRAYALRLFAFGTDEVAKRDLILVDTKYEFGLMEGKVVLADEIHTLDSSRFWVHSTINERRARGEAPEMLDKEPIRRWLMEQGYMGDGVPPVISDDYRIHLMRHYITSYERITGLSFNGDTRDPIHRISQNLKAYFRISE